MTHRSVLPRSFVPSSLTTLAIGASLMYYLDPQQGKRRRALVSDQLSSISRCAREDFEAASRDIKNRAGGTVAKLNSRFSSEEVPDQVLVERVRSKMGRYVSNPHAVEVSAEEGRVTLRGQIPTWEALTFVSALRKISGIRSVDNQMEQFDDISNVPSLQGAKEKSMGGPRAGIMQQELSPTARLLTTSLIGYSLLRALPKLSFNTLAFVTAGASLIAPRLAEGIPGESRKLALQQQQREQQQGVTRPKQQQQQAEQQQQQRGGDRGAQQQQPGGAQAGQQQQRQETTRIPH